MESWISKLIVIIVMFSLTISFGNIPLRCKVFQQNQRILSLSSAFSGGLFLSIGVLHLMPEANESIERSFPENSVHHFPWCFFIVITSFTIVLFFQKILLNRTHSSHLPHNTILKTTESDQLSSPQSFNEIIDSGKINLTPFILQSAMGVHSIFEGLAIGIQQSSIQVFQIAFVIVFHKWAEGFTLGLTFKKSKANLTLISIMILIQALMLPIGVIIGWLLSNQGDLVTGIFMSINTGTFLYIATMNILFEEFSLDRYKILKFAFFLSAIGLIILIWFIEQSIHQ